MADKLCDDVNSVLPFWKKTNNVNVSRQLFFLSINYFLEKKTLEYFELISDYICIVGS